MNMTKLALIVYDFLSPRPALRWSLLAVLVILSAFSLSRLEFQEDITAFLPSDKEYSTMTEIYNEANQGDRFFILVSSENPDEADHGAIASAIDSYVQLTEPYGWETTSEIDYGQIFSKTGFIYSNAPLLLTERDYERMEGLMNADSVKAAMTRNMESLLFPSGPLAAQEISSDPLGLFKPLIDNLRSSGNNLDYELDDGYIFTPDGRYGIVMVSSKSGVAESGGNGEMLKLLEEAALQVEADNPLIEIGITGAPVIAVDNADRIKKDSTIILTAVAVLIIALLMFTLKKPRAVFLIGLSVVCGWLFAAGLIGCFRSEVSIIVLGIASVIIGIAVNYPLHYITHLQHCGDRRKALEDIVNPLAIGNITTVGAFCTLLPLKSVALRDFGLFAAFMLIGTIIFVVIFLPHLCKEPESKEVDSEKWNLALGRKRPLLSRPVPLCIFVLVTVFLGAKSSPGFDSNLSNINYMSGEQKGLMKELSKMRGESPDGVPVYMVTTGTDSDEALANAESLGDEGLIASIGTQEKRIARWEEFKSEHADILGTVLTEEAVKAGLSAKAFSAFNALLGKDFQPEPADYFSPLAGSAGVQSIGSDKVIKTLNMSREEADAAIAEQNSLSENRLAFGTAMMNGRITTVLSDSFNIVTFLCGFIVFAFLWISFKRFYLALIAFLPMTVSWFWILGIMNLTGMQFNIVNIILATFIFGQGDDYSIFMTEGLLKEERGGEPVLGSYVRSNMISAAIMFIGIGSLAASAHPAMQSLGLVTIVGMFSVVVMTLLIPPAAFWLVRKLGLEKKEGRN